MALDSDSPMETPESAPADLETLEGPLAIRALAASPAAPILAVAGERQILIVHTETNEVLGAIPFPEGRPESLKFSPNGFLLAAAGGSPGAEGTYRGYVRVRVGRVAVTLNGKLTVGANDPEARRIVLAGGGADGRVPGSVRVRITMSVEPKDAELTDLVVVSEANILGKLGEFGQGLIRRKADGIMKDFGQNLSDTVGRN